MKLPTGMKNKKWLIYFSMEIFFLLSMGKIFSQTTYIKGFAESRASVVSKNASFGISNKVSFGLGEQDLFITSELSDRLSFLGETVFRYDPFSHSEFAVSIERIQMKYNISGNNNILIGKVHSPLNYWNDTYHHGRVFFPTIDRPYLFEAEIIPLHTTGIQFQGHDIGKIKFGYDALVGNGLGSNDVADNDGHKSWTAAVHIKPIDKLRIGASYYNDVISKGARLHEGRVNNQEVSQQLYSGSVSYFGKKFEILAESTAAMNRTDSNGTKQTLASYFYGGYKINEKLVAYFRVDDLHYQAGELFFVKNNTRSFLVGMRFKLNYLAVIKLEYLHRNFELGDSGNSLTAQVAVGF